MSSSNKGAGVDSRLQSLVNALYLTDADDVAIRTGITGDIIIQGNVNVPGTVTVDSSDEDPVHVHICGVDLPGNVVPITGNVNISNLNAIPVTVNPSPITGFYSFNNFGVNANRGWTMQNTEIPMFAVRVKPGSAKSFRLINYDIGNNNANQSTIGYTWYNAPTITGPAWSWVDIGTTGIQYAVFNDCYGSNTPNGLTGGALNHSGIVIGKTNSDMTPEMKDAAFTDGGMTMVCAVRRMDNATKLDVWFGVTLVTLT